MKLTPGDIEKIADDVSKKGMVEYENAFRQYNWVENHHSKEFIGYVMENGYGEVLMQTFRDAMKETITVLLKSLNEYEI